MRLTPILIQEGRKEDLQKKYTEKFKEYPENLDFILGISDLVKWVVGNTQKSCQPYMQIHYFYL
jgi:hypothetical protein